MEEGDDSKRPTEIIDRKLVDVRLKHVYKQILACVIAHSIVIQAGINLSYSAVLLPQLREPDSPIKITTSDGSWIASLVTIALPFGSVIVGPIIDRLGRKRFMMATCALFIANWLLQANAATFTQMCLTRIVAGFTGGLTTSSLVYVSEIVHPDYRSMALSLNSVFVSLGILLTCLIGKWCHWRTMAYVYSASACLTLALLAYIPESPQWLFVFKKDPQLARRSLRWLYVDDEMFNNQYEEITKLKRSDKTDNSGTSERSRLLRLKDNLSLYKQPSVYKPILILLGLFAFQQLSGAYVIIVYAVDLFREVGCTYTIDEYVALILLGVIRFLVSIISALLSKRVGRRPLLAVSGIGMIATSLLAGVYMYANKGEQKDQLLPLVCLLLYVCFGSLGFLVIPWTLIGELLHIKVKGTMGGCLISYAYILMFFIVKMFPYVLAYLKMPLIFMLMAGVNVLSVLYVHVYLPETLGKTFSEIENMFS